MLILYNKIYILSIAFYEFIHTLRRAISIIYAEVITRVGLTSLPKNISTPDISTADATPDQNRMLSTCSGLAPEITAMLSSRRPSNSPTGSRLKHPVSRLTAEAVLCPPHKSRPASRKFITHPAEYTAALTGTEHTSTSGAEIRIPAP